MYFINKFWIFVSTIHPLSYITIIVIIGLLFFITKLTIKKFRPQTSKLNIVAISLTVFLELPILGLIIYLIIDQLLKNQPF